MGVSSRREKGEMAFLGKKCHFSLPFVPIWNYSHKLTFFVLTFSFCML